jgi:hypothetical protein
MILQATADRVLDVVLRISPETRYEEKTYFDGGRQIKGTNAMLRDALNAEHREWCDVVFEVAQNRAWIQVKHAWTWHTYRKPAGRNKSYWKHLFGTSGNSALLDATEKLPRLIGRQGVDILGLLVVAIDSDERPFPDGDINLLEQLARMNQGSWRRFSRPRCTSLVSGYETVRIQPFLWLRPAAEMGPKRETSEMDSPLRARDMQ